MPDNPNGMPAQGMPALALPVDVVVPVFNAYQVTRRCIESVLASRPNNGNTPFELVIVDDASTEPELVRYLDDLAASGRATLVRNVSNRGFVHSANCGLGLHPERDVLLLNSDTEVANDWLDRIRACAYREADVGTVTPFSNNATICSYPVFCADNPLPEGMTPAAMDAAFARANAGRMVAIPTAVGFCMYIRRACLDAVGMFDEARFGRGYGEENDFCRRALAAGWRSVLGGDVFVYHAGSASFGGERAERVREAEAVLQRLQPDYLADVHAFIRADPAAPLRRAVEIELARQRRAEGVRGTTSRAEGNAVGGAGGAGGGVAFSFLSPRAAVVLAGRAGKSIQLHVMHDLAGGIERWCRDFCRADSERINLILKPFCRGHAAGEGLMLFADIDDAEPIGLWVFEKPFEVSAATHPEYAQAIKRIVDDYGVEAILVSSLIGHALDVLDTGLPTVVIAHDYFPACPAINLYYDGVCERCDDARLADCTGHNPDFNPFLLFSAEERIVVRRRWLEIVESCRVTAVVPSRVVWDHLARIFPSLARASWVPIPHGTDQALAPIAFGDAGGKKKLRVVVLGMLSVAKGVRLLADALDRLTEFAEVHLVGTQELGELYMGRPNVHVVTRYALDELQGIVQGIRPHVGLLLSILPETFSYTLTELMQMGVPPVATHLGGFAERVIDGETGFLVAPTADALVARLKEIDGERGMLERVRKNLAGLPRRGAAEMVADYHRLLPLSTHGSRAMAPAVALEAGRNDALGIRQAMAMTAMWKQIKSLDLQLAMSREARPRLAGPSEIAETQRRAAEHQRAITDHQRAVAEHQRTIAESQRAIAESQRAIAEQQRAAAEARLAEEAGRYQARAEATKKELAEKESQRQNLHEQVRAKEEQLAAIYASTSWRVTSPIRAVGTFVRRARFLAQHLGILLKEPEELPKRVGELNRAWRTGGRLHLRLTLQAMRAEIDHQEAWKIWQQTFAREVRPLVAPAIAAMPTRPLISVLVPTYNTPEAMLRQMLDSVRGQLYDNWELCVADDCSGDPRVGKVLGEYAARDGRIKLHLASENRGVAHASNRALEMATGQFTVLLDHDDLLQEQALFRVAQSVAGEDPDLLYSDEIMVSADLKKVLRYAHRPAFSPEFLRSHPYIVHLVGFRTELLRALGGFDESLTISQDYDLILRAAERARTVVHVPEILYQWRIHGGSSGTRQRDDVMATSRAILERHLRRGGEAGHVEDGPAFNLFDTRYPLAAGARVAIVIPTKNHGDLVRQCVDSIRATVRDIDYDIVVIDHESDDPATIDYLSSIASEATILHYQGPFNFSAINNWAVSRLGGRHTHYLFCNNDIEAIESGWLERMMELGQHPDVGIVGAQLLYPDRVTIQHAGVCVGAYGAAEHYGKFIRVPDIPRYLGFSEILRSNHEVSAVTAACLLIRREAFESAGGFDEALAVGFGDVDLCLRVGQLGYRVVQCPRAELLHHESFTRGKAIGMDPHPEDSALFRSRWAGLLHAGDPYFNPGLDQNSTAWLMKYPMPCGLGVRRRIYRRAADSGRQSFAHSPP